MVINTFYKIYLYFIKKNNNKNGRRNNKLAISMLWQFI